MNSVIKIRKIEHSYKSNENAKDLKKANTINVTTNSSEPKINEPNNGEDNNPILAKTTVTLDMKLTNEKEGMVFLELKSKFEVISKLEQNTNNIDETIIEEIAKNAIATAGSRFIMDVEYVLYQFNLPMPNLPFDMFSSHTQHEESGGA